jgi:hypothetical protein
MTVTLAELKEKLAQTFDEVTLLELLNINASEIVEAFEEKIEARFNKLVHELDTEEWED